MPDRTPLPRPSTRSTPATATATATRRTRRTPRAAAVCLATVLALVGAACGSEPDPATVAGSSPPPSTAEPAPAPTGTGDDEAADHGALVVRSDRDLPVHAAPGDAEPHRVLPATTDFGSGLALLVTGTGTDDARGWYEVLVPGRPNGGTGWVRTADVTVRRVTLEVEVDLAARILRVLDDGEEVLVTPVAIGDAAHPTPTGRFSLTDTLDTGAPDGPYGPYALGLSGRSEVLTEFAGGDGQIGIHGTDDPSSIGEAVSHGCVRVPNDVAATLAGSLPLGTPVTIR